MAEAPQAPELTDCQASLIRKTKVLKRWKEEWLNLRTGADNRGHLERNGKELLCFEPGQFEVAPTSDDPASPDFLGFQLRVATPGASPKIAYFRATDAANFRKWMLALGSRGAGVCAQVSEVHSADGVSFECVTWLSFYVYLYFCSRF